MLTEDQVLQKIDRFRKKNRMSETAFGVNAVKNPNFVRDLRTKKSSPTLKTLQKVQTYMDLFE